VSFLKKPQRAVLPDLFLGLALLWAIVVVVVLARYHVPEPLGATSVTTNGHTYYGNPPALTMPESDPVSFAVITITMGLGVVVGIGDLVVRKLRSVSGWGQGAVIAGIVVILMSLFGLLLGLASIGVDGALIILSGMPSASRNSEDESNLVHNN
jgi:hypothetical protein